MAKKKKDPEKKAALAMKKEAKADKAARKRIHKEAKKNGDDVDEENVDELLEIYRQKDAEVSTTIVEPLGQEFPLPRANATLTLSGDDKNGQLYLFGGEYFDGVENVVLDELLRWDSKKRGDTGEWKRILTPAPHPPPRCAHSTVYFRNKNALYVFGGEMATADQYHHYRDLWRFDLKTQTWSEIVTRSSSSGTAPSARSGQVAFVWKQYLIIFGGFYEALRDTRWHNDVCVMDLVSHTWLEIPHSKLAIRPEPRSACNASVFGDTAIIHGGFSKLKNPTTKAESKVHTDSWMLHLKPILTGKPPTWERMSIRDKKGATGRSGTASVSYKNRMLVYGGVVDEEQHHHLMDSVFYNDLFAFDIERRKWFPLKVKSQSNQVEGKSRRRRKKTEGVEGRVDDIIEQKENSDESSDLEEEDDNNDDTGLVGWDLDKLRSNMFAFIDGDGNIVYEKIDENENEDDGYEGDSGEPSNGRERSEESKSDDEEREEEKDEEKMEEKDEEKEEETKNVPKQHVQKAEKGKVMLPGFEGQIISSSSVMSMNVDTGMPMAVVRTEPLPRINSAVIVQNDILYIYGGLLEVGDREVTLDDCWSFDLRKRDRWVCIWEGTMHKQVWRGVVPEDDDDSYISTGVESDGDEDIKVDGDESNEEGDVEREARATKKPSKKEKKSKRSGLRQEIADIKEDHDLDDASRTPLINEQLAEFYSRTSEYWNQQGATKQTEIQQASNTEGERLSSKELKREGFNLARERFDELRPILDRLNELSLQQEEAETERKTRKGEKSKSEKDPKAKDKKRKEKRSKS